MAVLVLLVYLSRPVAGLRWQQIVLTAVLLVALALFRRWYNFWVVAFLLVAGAEGAVAAAREWPRGGWRAALRAVRPAVAVGAVSGVLLASVALPLVRNVLAMDYAGAYAAYRDPSPFGARAANLCDELGWLVPSLLAGGFACLMPVPHLRRPAAYLGAGVAVMLVLFLRTQDFGPHHWYLFLPAAVLLPGLALARLLARLPRWPAWTAVVVVGGVGATHLIAVFVPGAGGLHADLRPWVPKYRYPPLTREDLAEVRGLMRFLSDETDRTGEVVAVVGSGPDFNPTTLRSAGRSLREPFAVEGRLLRGDEVDRVSQFPEAVFRAGLVVVADPPQTHLRPGEQQTVIVPADELLTGTGVGRAFDRLPTAFHLRGGVTVHVFRRARPIPRSDFETFRGKLRAAHPHVSGVFTPTAPAEELLRVPAH